MFKKILYLFAIIVLAVIAVIGYWGFIPGVSYVLGSTKPRDLGVASTSEALASAEKKSGVDFAQAPATQTTSIAFSGRVSGKGSFTGEEITSIVRESAWKDFPAENFQMRINDDGTVEVSGKMMLEKIPAYLAAHGLPVGKAQWYIEKAATLGINPPLYVKFESTWKDNQVSLTPHRIEVGRYSVSQEQYAEHEDVVTNGIETVVRSVPNINIESIDYKGGTLNAVGAFPATVSTKR